ncbi:unnamed protein product, partial [Symbiodinium sp. KB8]
MKPHLLNEAISSSEVIAADRAPEPPATTENEPTTADGVDRFATFVSPGTVREIKQRPMRSLGSGAMEDFVVEAVFGPSHEAAGRDGDCR